MHAKVKPHPCRLWLDGEYVRYDVEGQLAWRLAIGEIRLIGEYTTDCGPLADDYFLCFATGAGRWWEASYYSDEFMRGFAAIGERLDADLRLGLAGSTDYASRILWPAHLAGEPMFTFTALQGGSLWERVRRFFGPTMEWTLSEVAREALDSDDAGSS